MRNIPAEIIALLGTLVAQIKPRYNKAGILQVACPRYETKIRSRLVKHTYYSALEDYSVDVYHRMKLNLERNKWWCPACRKGGALSTLKPRIAAFAESD